MLGRARQAEVGDLRHPLIVLAIHQDVGRLEIAVNDALCMDRRQTLGDADRDLHRQRNRQRLGILIEERSEIAVRDELGDEIENVFARVVEEVVHAEDVQRLAGDSRRVQRLVLEPLGVLGAELDALHRIHQPGPPMPGLEDDAESARPHLANEVVVACLRNTAAERWHPARSCSSGENLSW